MRQVGLAARPSEGPARPPTEDEDIARVAQAARLKVTVIGCGGAGSNTVHRCVDDGIEGAELCAINTDVAHLLTVRAHRKILLGRKVTGGRGAGARPEVGHKAAEESEAEIRRSLEGSHIVFVTAGLGGGTGTGSAPVVARIAKGTGALTVAVVSLPFQGEGELRREVALEGLAQLRGVCDTTIVLENDRLLDLHPHASLAQGFRAADETLATAIKGVTETLTRPGLVNLDFADLRTVMQHAGLALIASGQSGSGSDRARDAVEAALRSPLLGPIELGQVSGGLVHVAGDLSLTVSEAERVVALVTQRVSKKARIIWGCRIEPGPARPDSVIRVMLILGGVGARRLTPLPSENPVTEESPRPEPRVEETIVRADSAPSGVPQPFAFRIRAGILPRARRLFRREKAPEG